MNISFKIKKNRGYFITSYHGHISNEEHINAFKYFFSEGGWMPGMNELAIASKVKNSSVNMESLRHLIILKNNFYKKHNIINIKIAIYAPGDLAFGIARMYDTLAEGEESPEKVKPFRQIKEALSWLKN